MATTVRDVVLTAPPEARAIPIRTHASPSEAWASWTRDELDRCPVAAPADGAAALKHGVAETFRRMRTHFRQFGFLTDATLDTFVDRVLVPNARR